MNAIAHYLQQTKQNEELIGNLAKDDEALQQFTRAHNYITELEKVISTIEARPEHLMLALASRELQNALYFAATAQYRSAHVHLRLYLELSLGGIQFSTNLLKLRKWITRSQDIVWDSIIEDQAGVFSTEFVTAFCPGLQDHSRQYCAIAKTAYRECSEFVHGNIHTFEDTKQPINFDQIKLLNWLGRADAIYTCFLFAFCSRYLSELPAVERTKIEGEVLATLSHLPPIRQLYEATQ